MSEEPTIQRAAYKMDHAAVLLDCSRAYLYRLAAAGKVKTVKIGGARRISHAEIERLARDGAS